MSESYVGELLCVLCGSKLEEVTGGWYKELHCLYFRQAFQIMKRGKSRGVGDVVSVINACTEHLKERDYWETEALMGG